MLLFEFDAPSAKEWINKVYSQFQPWPMDHNQRVMVLGGEGDDQQFAWFELAPSMTKRGAVEVKWFGAHPQRQGVGGRAMEVLQDLARKDNITLTLFPWQHGNVSQSKLTKFYKRAGYQPVAKGSKSLYWSPSNG